MKIATTTTTTTRMKNDVTCLGRAQLFIYPGKGHNLHKNLKIHKYIYRALNKLCNQVLYQYFIQRILFGHLLMLYIIDTLQLFLKSCISMSWLFCCICQMSFIWKQIVRTSPDVI